MFSLKPVLQDYGGPLCRRCLNRRYDVHLAHRDCRHSSAPQECPCCKKTETVVTGLRLGGRIKLLMK